MFIGYHILVMGTRLFDTDNDLKINKRDIAMTNNSPIQLRCFPLVTTIRWVYCGTYPVLITTRILGMFYSQKWQAVPSRSMGLQVIIY